MRCENATRLSGSFESYKSCSHAGGGGSCDVPLEIAVHDGEEDLKEEVDGVDQDRQKEQPCFSRHHGDG
jgi:hypothetical protein